MDSPATTSEDNFLTINFDLSQTVFSDNDLNQARVHLESWIKREKSSWLKNPQGELGKYWKQNGVIGACHLINFSQMIDKLTQKITPESISRLNDKIKKNLLPRPSDIKQFDETFAELEVAYELLEYVSPLTIEPPIPGQLKGPDIAFRLPEGIAYLDVTVFRGGPLEKWEDAKKYISEELHKKVRKYDKALDINIYLGIEPINKNEAIKQAWDKMYESDTNEILVGNKGKIQWRPINLTVTGGKIRRAVASQATVALPSQEDVEEINRLLFNALCNKLKDKREQFPRDEPAFLIMKIGHPGIPVDKMDRVIKEHIWRKDDYRWISGIVLFTPRQGFFKTDRLADLPLIPNPRAKCPINRSFLSIFAQHAHFHY